MIRKYINYKKIKIIIITRIKTEIILGPKSFKIIPQLDSKQEKIRLKFKPKKISYLFIGESMPAGGTFFYFENSNLYFHLRDVFLNNFNWDKLEFLKYFKSNGFYLDDLCQQSINQLSSSEKTSIRKAYEENLSLRIKKYKPNIIITTPKSIVKNVNRSIIQAELNIKNITLPFPAMGHQNEFDKELDIIIKEVINPLFNK